MLLLYIGRGRSFPWRKCFCPEKLSLSALLKYADVVRTGTYYCYVCPEAEQKLLLLLVCRIFNKFLKGFSGKEKADLPPTPQPLGL